MNLFKNSDKITAEFVNVIENPIIPKNKKKLLVGVDLGTAYIVISVLDENKNPIAGAYRFAQVVKDGIVVDYMGALRIVKELKKEIEDKIGCELINAAVAIPPGTTIKDTRYIKNVAEGAGFEVINVVDEPTAANAVLGIKNGVVVDIGGGTTGLAVIKDGEIVEVADEATGGTQCTLVLAGSYNVPFEEAEMIKQDPEKQREVSGILKPVAQKIATIIKTSIDKYEIDGIYLVGGTSCLLDIEKVIEKELKIKTYKPKNPHFVTPIGIAMNCIDNPKAFLMISEIIKSPSEGVLKMLKSRSQAKDFFENHEFDTVGLVQGKLVEMLVATDIGEKAANVTIIEIKGVCPQHMAMIAVLGDTGSVIEAIDSISNKFKGGRSIK